MPALIRTAFAVALALAAAQALAQKKPAIEPKEKPPAAEEKKATAGDPDAATQQALARVQEERVCWMGATRWHGMDAIRISVSNWSTTEEDVERSADSIIRAVRKAG